MGDYSYLLLKNNFHSKLTFVVFEALEKEKVVEDATLQKSQISRTCGFLSIAVFEYCGFKYY